jgi:hypothetical protein
MAAQSPPTRRRRSVKLSARKRKAMSCPRLCSSDGASGEREWLTARACPVDPQDRSRTTVLTARLSGHQVMINGHALSPPLSFMAAVPVGPEPQSIAAAVWSCWRRRPRSRNVTGRGATAAPDPPYGGKSQSADMPSEPHPNGRSVAAVCANTRRRPHVQPQRWHSERYESYCS